MLSDATLAALLAFRSEREWEQFHTPKNLAIGIAVEAAELLELYQWTLDSSDQAPAATTVQEEIADVCILLSYLAHDLGVDLEDAVRRKLAVNAARYPVEHSRGNARKHDAVD